MGTLGFQFLTVFHHLGWSGEDLAIEDVRHGNHPGWCRPFKFHEECNIENIMNPCFGSELQLIGDITNALYNLIRNIKLSPGS
jgi:hypothetical protein